MCHINIHTNQKNLHVTLICNCTRFCDPSFKSKKSNHVKGGFHGREKSVKTRRHTQIRFWFPFQFFEFASRKRFHPGKIYEHHLILNSQHMQAIHWLHLFKNPIGWNYSYVTCAKQDSWGQGTSWQISKGSGLASLGMALLCSYLSESAVTIAHNKRRPTHFQISLLLSLLYARDALHNKLGFSWHTCE